MTTSLPRRAASRSPGRAAASGSVLERPFEGRLLSDAASCLSGCRSQRAGRIGGRQGHPRHELGTHQGAENPGGGDRRCRDPAAATRSARHPPGAHGGAGERDDRAHHQRDDDRHQEDRVPGPGRVPDDSEGADDRGPVIGEAERPIDRRLEPEVESRHDGGEHDQGAEDGRRDPPEAPGRQGHEDQHDGDRLHRKAQQRAGGARGQGAGDERRRDEQREGPRRLRPPTTRAASAPRRTPRPSASSPSDRRPSGRWREAVRQRVLQQHDVADPASVREGRALGRRPGKLAGADELRCP